MELASINVQGHVSQLYPPDKNYLHVARCTLQDCQHALLERRKGKGKVSKLHFQFTPLNLVLLVTFVV
jgi:hypothetical protein